MILTDTYTPVCMPKLTMNYALTLPSDYKEGEALPMIVFLHGAGERGNDIEEIKRTGFPQLFLNDPDYKGHRVITLCPQCPHDLIWNNIIYGAKELIDFIAKKYQPTRIALTGLSMGGYGTWDMSCAFPNDFQAIAPICGGGVTWRAGLIAHLPIRTFHSIGDPIVCVENSKLMVKAVNACGGTAELTLYESDEHNCWDEVYQNTDLIDWLLTAVPENR